MWKQVGPCSFMLGFTLRGCVVMAIVMGVTVVVTSAVVVGLPLLCKVVVVALCCRVSSHCVHVRQATQAGLSGGFAGGRLRCHSWVVSDQVRRKAWVRTYSSTKCCVSGHCSLCGGGGASWWVALSWQSQFTCQGSSVSTSEHVSWQVGGTHLATHFSLSCYLRKGATRRWPVGGQGGTFTIM